MAQQLRGLVLNKFKSITEFATAIGWKRGKASRIVNNVTEPDCDDIYALVDCLDINTQEEFMQIFFPKMSTKWTA